jgi:Virulence factor membrane-bound polymerase, C-terminal/O-Antigen ligase/Protein glycosylation ligase
MQGVLVLLGLVIFLAGWLVSGHFPPWTAFQQQWFTALGLSIVALGGAWNRARWRWPAPAVFILALAAVPVLQRTFGQIVFLSDAILPALFIAAFALCIAAAANLSCGEPQQWADSLMITLLAAAVASTGLALMQWLHYTAPAVPLYPLPPGGRPYANLAQSNHLATLLGLGIAASLYLFERQRLGPLVVGLLAAWLGFGLLMTQSRTGWLFLVLLAGWWAAGRRYLRIRFVPLAIGLAVFSIGVWQWTNLNQLLLLADPSTTLDERLGGGLRTALWRAMVEAVGDSPWVGWGWNQVVLGHLAVAYEHEAGQRVFQSAHSIVLDLMLWMGIPLALLLLAFTGYWLWRQARQCSDGARWGLLLAVGAIGAHAVTEYPLDYTYFLLTLGMLVGTLHGLQPVGRWWFLPRATFVVPWAACVGLMFWLGLDYMKVEESARQLRLVLSGVGVDRVAYAPPPDSWLLDELREYHRFLITPVQRGMDDEQLAWMRNVAQRNPAPGSLLRLALATGLNGRGDESARILRAACHIHPPKRCAEVRESWRAAQQQFPELVAVPLP